MKKQTNFMLYHLSLLMKVPLVNRSLHTFWQGFLGTFLVGVPLVVSVAHTHDLDHGKAALVALIVASFMAGLSACKTLLKDYVKSL